MQLEQLLADIGEDVKALRDAERSESRYVGPGADRDEAERVAGETEAVRTAKRVGEEGPEGGDLLRSIRAARRGDPDAYRRLGRKAWVEGTDSAGGFLVPPEQLPGYLEARRAASPLRELCTHYSVRSNEVWIVTEGNSVTVQHLAEGATKPDTTGSLAQLVSTVHKTAGTSHVSDELLADSSGNAAQIIARQFAQATATLASTATTSSWSSHSSSRRRSATPRACQSGKTITGRPHASSRGWTIGRETSRASCAKR